MAIPGQDPVAVYFPATEQSEGPVIQVPEQVGVKVGVGVRVGKGVGVAFGQGLQQRKVP